MGQRAPLARARAWARVRHGFVVIEVEFLESDYLSANPDVAAAVARGQFRNGWEHYQLYGKGEGRATSKVGLNREEKALSALDKDGLGLEIGPSHRPIAPKKRGFNVHILDHLSADDLRKKYAGHAEYGVDIENIEEVDFVWNGEPLTELIGRKACYDWIIASHVCEHVPDLVSFFQQCEALLKPTGRLSLIIPDKRYCFDYFNAISTTGDVLDAFEEKRTRPSVGQVFDYIANSTKLAGAIAWGAQAEGDYELIHSIQQARIVWGQARSSVDYIDVHCWRFTPEGFRLVLSDLNLLGLSRMSAVSEFDTTGCEFYVTLGKKRKAEALDRLGNLKRIYLEQASPAANR